MINQRSSHSSFRVSYEHSGVRQDVLLYTQKHLAALEVGTGTRNSCLLNILKDAFMVRKKSEERSHLLSHPIILRVTEDVFKKLEKLQQESNCQSVGEVGRKILSGEKILCFYKDVTMNAHMEELSSIRKELKAIGVNINQQTKYFHTSDNEAQRAFYVLKTADLYKGIDAKVERLLALVSQLSERWLQRS